MEVRAVAKYIRVQPRKVRLVAKEIKGAPAALSAHKLAYHPSKGASSLRKVLISAIANAAENHGVSAENLRVCRISVDEGPHIKRMTQRAQGRANRILKKTSHITVVLEEYQPATEVKAHGTQAKPRPKFDAPKKTAKKAEKVEAAPAEEPVAEALVEEPAAEATPVEAPTEAPTEAPAEEPAAETETKEEGN